MTARDVIGMGHGPKPGAFQSSSGCAGRGARPECPGAQWARLRGARRGCMEPPREASGELGSLGPPPRRRISVTAQDQCFLRSQGEFPGAAGDVPVDPRGSELGGVEREGLLRDSPVRSPAGRMREKSLLLNFAFLLGVFA